MDNDTECLDWTVYITQMTAYATKKLRFDSRLSYSDKDVLKVASDLVADAVESYLRNPKKFDPDLGDFYGYLTYNLLRSKISNHAKRKINQRSPQTIGELIEAGPDSYSTDPGLKLDLELAVKRIRHVLRSDQLLTDLFELKYLEDLDKAGCVDLLDISGPEFDNALKRLRRKMEAALSSYKA